MLLSSVISWVGSALAGLPDSASAEMLQRANVASRGTNHPDADRPGDIRTASGANSVPRGALTPTAVPSVVAQPPGAGNRGPAIRSGIQARDVWFVMAGPGGCHRDW
jgi:hypothetical protein